MGSRSGPEQVFVHRSRRPQDDARTKAGPDRHRVPVFIDLPTTAEPGARSAPGMVWAPFGLGQPAFSIGTPTIEPHSVHEPS